MPSSMMPVVPQPAVMLDVPRLDMRDGSAVDGTRMLAEECPIALTFNGSTYAVLMATPCDLEDFLVGFSVTEGIVDATSEILSLEIVAHGDGYEARAWVSEQSAAKVAARRRALLGPVGCGLCGIESIEEAMKSTKPVPEVSRAIPYRDITAGLRALEAGQCLNRRTRAHHAAAFWDGRTLIVREDVGRHNALDKLVGGLFRTRVALAGAMVIVTSRASVDLVQKAAQAGVSILVAVSAPTALAVRTATAAGMTLVGVARNDGFEIYSRPDRISRVTTECADQSDRMISHAV